MIFLAICAVAVKVNMTQFPWNDFDQESLIRASTRCKHFYKDAPCLKKFVKVDKQDYHAICGIKDEDNSIAENPLPLGLIGGINE